jgi:hypothetical protein
MAALRPCRSGCFLRLYEAGASGTRYGLAPLLDARCGLSLDVLQGHPRLDPRSARTFLDAPSRRMPFPIRALQVDGGSEFAAEFEQACELRNLPLFLVPPRSPKLNGHVERGRRTHHEGFY